MRFFGERISIKAACFLAAFAAVGAGFLFREHLAERADIQHREAYEHLTVSESAENLEKLSFSLSDLGKLNETERIGTLSDIRVSSALALSALGHISFEGTGSGELFAYLNAVTEISRAAIELGISEEAGEKYSAEKAPTLAVLSLLGAYAKRINEEALPHLGNDNAEFESKLSEIFSDTVLETVLYENGYGSFAQANGFSSIGGGMIDEHDAIDIASEHLGKKAYLTAEYSDAETPMYHVSGKNISAVISAKSGFLMQLLFDLPEGEVKINEDEAKEKADLFLGEIGFKNMKSVLVSSEHLSGLYVFEYAPVQNGILCLDERILVGVSHGSGRICLFDAVDHYRYRSKSLKLPQDIIPAEDIMAKYALTESPALCKIERKQGIESICYRIGEGENEYFVSALSGLRIDQTASFGRRQSIGS